VAELEETVQVQLSEKDDLLIRQNIHRHRLAEQEQHILQREEARARELNAANSRLCDTQVSIRNRLCHDWY
jgi:hypothetical protein